MTRSLGRKKKVPLTVICILFDIQHIMQVKEKKRNNILKLVLLFVTKNAKEEKICY